VNCRGCRRDLPKWATRCPYCNYLQQPAPPLRETSVGSSNHLAKLEALGAERASKKALSSRRCRECRTEIPIGAARCPNCYIPARLTDALPANSKPTPPGSGSIYLGLAGAVVGAILGLALGGVPASVVFALLGAAIGGGLQAWLTSTSATAPPPSSVRSVPTPTVEPQTKEDSLHSSNSAEERLRLIDHLWSQGLITADEKEERRREIIQSI
jgi:hypothetical protein